MLLKRILQKGGVRLVYTALLLFYAFRRKDVPSWAKAIVIGVIGYLVSPIDAIPDLTPIIGYTDDLGLLSYALVMIAGYINEDVRKNARQRLYKILGNDIRASDMEAVEKVL